MPDVVTSPSLARVARGDLCAGCGACAGVAPGKVQMQIAPPGYLRPVQSQSLSPAEEATIRRICPGLGQTIEAGGRQDDPLWGPYMEMRIGHATDPDIRFSGSSGGGISMILLHLIDTGVVDAVIQTTASPELPIGNTETISFGRDGILAAAGSRYAASAPLANMAQHLAEHEATGRRFAFVGKPCDVAAMRAWTEADPKVKAAVPVLLSFFCAGVPSHTGGKAVLKALGTDLEHTRSFRYRGNGWPGFATAVLDDGSERKMSYHDSWGKILSRHVQHRCKVCADGTGTAADLVCADAWESDERGYPLFEEGDGSSLIVVRTAAGAEALAGAHAAGRIESKPFDIPKLTAIQPGQRERRRALLARLAALVLCLKPIPRYRGALILQAARQNPLKRNLRNFLGTLRRALRPARVAR